MDYIKCELIGGVSPRHLNTFTPAIHAMYCSINRLYLIFFAIVDCTHVGSATASFEDLVTLHRRTLQQIFW